MTPLTPSPQMVALVQASTALPILLLSLWSGAVADDRDRRRVMLAAQGFMLLVSISLARDYNDRSIARLRCCRGRPRHHVNRIQNASDGARSVNLNVQKSSSANRVAKARR